MKNCNTIYLLFNSLLLLRTQQTEAIKFKHTFYLLLNANSHFIVLIAQFLWMFSRYTSMSKFSKPLSPKFRVLKVLGKLIAFTNWVITWVSQVFRLKIWAILKEENTQFHNSIVWSISSIAWRQNINSGKLCHWYIFC